VRTSPHARVGGCISCEQGKRGRVVAPRPARPRPVNTTVGCEQRMCRSCQRETGHTHTRQEQHHTRTHEETNPTHSTPIKGGATTVRTIPLARVGGCISCKRGKRGRVAAPRARTSRRSGVNREWICPVLLAGKVAWCWVEQNIAGARGRRARGQSRPGGPGLADSPPKIHGTL